MPLVGPDPTPTDANGVFAMPFPDLGIPDYTHSNATPCFLFRTAQVGNPFKIQEENLDEYTAQRENFSRSLGSEVETPESNPESISQSRHELGLFIYPNPIAGNELHVDLLDTPNNMVGIRFELFDIAGKSLLAGVLDAKQNVINIEEYASGTYNLRVWLTNAATNNLIIKAR